MTKGRPTKDTIPNWKKRVWKIFSLYIRTKETKNGYGRCVTCGQLFSIKRLQAGHFIPGRRNSILFDERGVHIQCERCNKWLYGNPIQYYDYMKRTYGQKIIDELYKKAKEEKQFTVPELKRLYEYYKAKLQSLSN